MKLYLAKNGFFGFSFFGFSDVHCMVIANNEIEAKKIAMDKFKDGSKSHGKDYYKNITLKIIFDDLTYCQVSEIED